MVVGEKTIAVGVKEFYTSKFVLSLDVGQASDFSAVSVLQHIRIDTLNVKGRAVALPRNRYDVRHLERLPLGLSYVAQAEYIGQLLSRPPLDLGCDFVIDETGVGRACADIFDSAGTKPTRVTITAGNEQTAHGPRTFHVPKGHLISALDARLHTGELRFAAGLREAGPMAEELKNFNRSVSAAGRYSYSARSGQKDDLVLSVALGLWFFTGQKKTPPAQIGRWGFGHPIKFNNPKGD